MVFPLLLVSYAFSFALPLRNRVRFLVLLASGVPMTLSEMKKVFEVELNNELLRQALNWALFRVWEKGRYTDLWLHYFSVSPF